MKLKKVIAAVTAAALAIGSLTAYSIVSPKFSLSAEAEPEEGKIIVDTEENSGLAFAFYDRAEDASGEPIEEIEDETNKYAVEANTEILAVVTLPEALEDGKKLSVFYGGESESFFENDKITFSFSFTMPEEGIVVGAEIKDLDIYNIITAVEDSDTGSVTINGQDASEGVQAAENSEVVVEARPAEGYEVGTVMVITDRETFGIDSGDSFVMPSGDVEVRVTFAEKSEGEYAINIYKNIYEVNWGTATVTVNGIESNTANENDTVTVTLKLKEGYVVNHINVLFINETTNYDESLTLTPDQSDENSYTFTMLAGDATIYASVSNFFEINTTITDNNMGSAYVTALMSNSNTYIQNLAEYHDWIKIIATPEKGYETDTIVVTADNGLDIILRSEKNYTTFLMPSSDVNVTVSFTERDVDAKTYTINTDDTTNGSVTVNSEGEEGERIGICCIPDTGYAIEKITLICENGETYSEAGIGNEYYIQEESIYNSNKSRLYSFTMPASNVTVSVSFKKNYAINYEPYPNGLLSLDGDFIIACEGKTLTLTALLEAGYTLEGCSVIDSDGNAVDTVIEANTITFTMPASDITVTIKVKKISIDNEYNITISSAENGSVSTDHETAENGDTVTLTVTPDEGYTFESCSVIDSEGNPVDTSVEENEITFIMPDSDVTVTVTFKEIDPEVTDPNEPDPEETSSETEPPATEETPSETETPTPEVTPSETETPTPEVTPSETETLAPEVTSSETETPAPDPGYGSEDLTIDIDEENKITGNNVIQAGGDVKPGETVDITDENSDVSASVKLPDNAESGLSFIITNKTDEIIDSANKILAEAAKIAAEKAKSIKSTIENILNNKSKGFAYELKFTDSSGNTAKVEGAFVKAALPIPENLLPENTGAASFFVYHATANGFEKINSIFNAANNTVEFAATSFSPYLITLEEITGGESENTASASSIPSFVIPALTLSSTEAAGTGSVTAAPIPTASSTSSVLTTVPPAAANVSPEANATPIDSADNMGKPDSESTADGTRDSSGTSSMGFADTNAATGLALELIPLLSVTAIGVLAANKKK